MLIFSILFLILSNAITLRRDKSILYSKVVIIILLYSSFIASDSLFFTYLYRGIGLYGGLFHATSTTHIFQIFIFLISAVILQLTGFYPRKVWFADYSSLSKLFLFKFVYYRTKIMDKMGEQYKIIEYPLIILFIISGALFFIIIGDLVSILWLSHENTLLILIFCLLSTFYIKNNRYLLENYPLFAWFILLLLNIISIICLFILINNLLNDLSSWLLKMSNWMKVVMNPYSQNTSPGGGGGGKPPRKPMSVQDLLTKHKKDKRSTIIWIHRYTFRVNQMKAVIKNLRKKKNFPIDTVKLDCYIHYLNNYRNRLNILKKDLFDLNKKTNDYDKWF